MITFTINVVSFCIGAIVGILIFPTIVYLTDLGYERKKKLIDKKS